MNTDSVFLILNMENTVHCTVNIIPTVNRIKNRFNHVVFGKRLNDDFHTFINIEDSDNVVRYSSNSVFYNEDSTKSGLMDILVSKGVKHVYISGLDTYVVSTVVDCVRHRLGCTVLLNCTVWTDEESKKRCLTFLKTCSVSVVDTNLTIAFSC